jgi:DNA polymerase (family 10)
MLYFTGSKDHNVKMRGLAQKKGMTLNEWGLYKLKDYDKAEKKTAEAPPIKPVASRTEQEIYDKLGMAYVEPEMREDRGEVEASIDNRLPKIIARADLRGDLHTHTTASDGQNTIEEMAEAAKALGYEYLAITDHSKSQAVANGLTVERLLKHVEAVRNASSRIKGITLLAGSEVDILADGRLDYEDDVLKELDIVIASPHFALKQETDKATDRILRAIDNRYVNIIGHPTGRLINGREGLPLDFDRVFKAAAANGTALEINAGYPRLDLDEHNARAAIAAGVLLSIDTDAHSTTELCEIQFGLGVARRAWATPDRVINCWPIARLKAFLNNKR